MTKNKVNSPYLRNRLSNQTLHSDTQRRSNWNLAKTSHMLEGGSDLKMHVRGLGYTFPYKSGTKAPFSTTSQSNGNFNGLYLRNETR